jgi:hypothetical protein
MKLFIAVTALVAASLVGYYVNAEPGAPGTFTDPEAYITPYPPPASVPYNVGRSIGRIESGLLELAHEFGGSLDGAVQDGLITDEQATKVVEELAFSLAVKKVRIDLLRVTKAIESLDQTSRVMPGRDEVRELRKLLPAKEAIELKSDVSAK